jgi:hypothetical protein
MFDACSRRQMLHIQSALFSLAAFRVEIALWIIFGDKELGVIGIVDLTLRCIVWDD